MTLMFYYHQISSSCYGYATYEHDYQFLFSDKPETQKQRELLKSDLDSK